MKGGKITDALILALGLGIISYGYFKQHKTGMEFYDRKEGRFIQREGGIDEKLLNSIKNPLVKKHLTSEVSVTFYEKAERSEQDLGFETLRSKCARSREETEFTLNRNYRILGAEYEELEELLSITDELYEKGKDELEEITRIYDFLSERFRPPKSGHTKGSATLIELIENEGVGDCNDLSPAYCAILDLYGIDCKLVFGTLIYADGEERGHAWLRVNLDGHTFDLDPTWYRGFVPLEPRS